MHALCSVCSLRDDSVITSKPTWKLKHANSILETFEYFRPISSKSIHIISSYTVSKLGPFLRHSVYYRTTILYCVCACACVELWGHVFLPPILNKEHITLYPLLIHTYVFTLVWQSHNASVTACVHCSVVRYPRYLDTYRRYLRDDTSIAKVTVYRGIS